MGSIEPGRRQVQARVRPRPIERIHLTLVTVIGAAGNRDIRLTAKLTGSCSLPGKARIVFSV